MKALTGRPGRKDLSVAGPVRRTGIVALALLGLCALSPAAMSASYSAPHGGIFVRMRGIPSRATSVFIEAQSPLTHAGAPKVIRFYLLATGPVTGREMTLTVPSSPLLNRIASAQHGVVNLAVVAESATRTYGRFFSARIAPQSISVASVDHIGRASFSHPRAKQPPVKAIPGRNMCMSNLLDSTEGVTRLGEMHIANTSSGTVTGHYDSNYVTDNVVTIGVSSSGASGTFSGGGSLTISDSVGSGGGFKHPGALSQYVDGHLYYGKYIDFGSICPTQYYVEATSSVGDAFITGTRSAPGNPYGSCPKDPNGLATLDPNGGYWGYDYSQAWTYSGVFSWYGFSFAGSNGFTHDVQERWDNGSSQVVYVCGNVNPVQDSRIFWNT